MRRQLKRKPAELSTESEGVTEDGTTKTKCESYPPDWSYTFPSSLGSC